MDLASSTVFVTEDVPSFEDLKCRGDLASHSLHEMIEEGRQLRQTLLYTVASNRRSVTSLWQARVRASRWLATGLADNS